MFARLLLMLTVVLGLAAGPAWTHEVRAAAVELGCGCCPIEVESCCVSAPSGSTERAPVQGLTSSPDYKQGLAPVLVCVEMLPEAAEVVKYDLERAFEGRVGAARLIDRICVRLI